MMFRQAAERDAAAALALYREAAAQDNCFWDEDYPDESFVKFDLAERGLFVLEENGMLIGAASLIAHDDLDELPIWKYGESCVLVRLCVRPARQGQGLARLMIEKISAEAFGRGYRSIRLFADRRNEIANALYQRMGFEKRGAAEMYGHGYWAWERQIER